MKRGIFIITIIAVLGISLVSAGFFDYFRDIDLSPSADTDVSVTVGNVAPVIVSVESISAVDLTPASTTDVTFTFVASDPNGVSDLDDSSATAEFTFGSEPTRSDTDGCSFVSEASGERTYTCTITMQSYDAPGSWTVTVGISNLTGPLTTTDSLNTVTLNLLRDISINPITIGFPTVIQGGTDIVSSATTTITNNGNFVVPTDGDFEITAYDLPGVTTPSDKIPAANFNAAGSSESDVCGGATTTTLADSTATVISSAALARGDTGNTEDIEYCITLVPAGIISQDYSTTGGTAWSLSI
jgi:hypothetical protein